MDKQYSCLWSYLTQGLGNAELDIRENDGVLRKEILMELRNFSRYVYFGDIYHKNGLDSYRTWLPKGNATTNRNNPI